MIKKSIIIKGYLFLLFIVFISCNTKNKDVDDSHNHNEKIFYTCSMDPQIKEDKPGKCAICQMELTPIKHDNSEANEISLSKQQIQLGNITTQSFSESQKILAQSYTGILAINQEKENTISARAMGRIEKLYFKTIGDYVGKNQAVYQLYSEDIAIAKQDYYAAYKQLLIPGDFGKNAQNMFKAAKQKLQYFGLSNAQIESIKTTDAITPYTIFYSTHSGIISEIMATEGSYLIEGAGVIKVTDLNSLWLETQVNVNYARSLKVGQTAKISFTDFPVKMVSAKVSFINPEINPNTRLLLIRMEIANPNLQLKPGMQALATLYQPSMKGLFIPTDAVIRDGNATYIWVEKRLGVFENLMVEIGVESNGMIEITSAIDPSKKVVITGAYGINSEYIFRNGIDPMAGMKM
jgi:Cu(I)/Ag(I) efflux system membrane fusion protein